MTRKRTSISPGIGRGDGPEKHAKSVAGIVDTPPLGSHCVLAATENGRVEEELQSLRLQMIGEK